MLAGHIFNVKKIKSIDGNTEAIKSNEHLEVNVPNSLKRKSSMKQGKSFDRKKSVRFNEDTV